MIISATGLLKPWATGTFRHDRCRVSPHPVDLKDPEVNIAHLRRPSLLPVRKVEREVQHLGLGFKRKASLPSTPLPATLQEWLQTPASAPATELLRDLRDEGVRAQLLQDIFATARTLRSDLGFESVGIKLQVVSQTSCPKYHADHVGVRALVTYCGPGTWFITNRYATREWHWFDADVSVSRVDPSKAVQAAAGDVLFLKGHTYDGGANFGMGAVHRSPDIEEDGSPRLLLVVEDQDFAQHDHDAAVCSCAHAHS
ncbi:MAG: hypothetical protein WDW36_004892 [Sanguina aurantia]